MSSSGYIRKPLLRLPEGTSHDDLVAVEEPLEIRIDGEPLAVTMRTPGDDAELAAGFCLTEGVIDHVDSIERVEPCNEADYGNVVLVTLAEEFRASHQQRIANARREFYMSSSCGLCGTKTIDLLSRKIAPLETAFVVEPSTLIELPARMAEVQESFSRTGGLHAAAIFTPGGELRLLREDVGRHNAVDKVIGALLLSGQIPFGPGVLLVSGRSSFELVQKAARAGIAFLAAVGAPTSLAVDTADRFGMTLVGFLRSRRFNVYCDRGRIRPQPAHLSPVSFNSK